jgi:hypothetical protein
MTQASCQHRHPAPSSSSSSSMHPAARQQQPWAAAAWPTASLPGAARLLS